MMTNTSKPVPASTTTPTRTAARRRRWSSVDPGALDTETRKHILLASTDKRSMTLEELFIVSPRGRRNLKRRNAMDLINHPAFEQQDEQEDYDLTKKKLTRRMVASRSCSALLSEHHNYGSTYNRRPNNSRNCSRDKAPHPYDGQQGARRISTPNSLTGNFYQDYHDKNKAYTSCSRTRKVMLERTDELRYEDSTSISSSSSTSSSNNNDKRRSIGHQLEPTDFVDTGYIPRNENEENKYSKDKTNYSLTSWWGKMQKKQKQKDNNNNSDNDDRRMKMRSMKMTRSMKDMFSRSLQLLPDSTNDNDDYLEDDIIQTRMMILERSKSRNESNLHNYLSSY